MNLVNFTERSCERYRRYFDAYLDHELIVETNDEVLQHLTSCKDCTRILENRARAKEHVKNAVRSEEVPLELAATLRDQFRAEHPSFYTFAAGHWVTAATALLILVIGGVSALQWGRVIGFPGDNDVFENVSARVQEILRVGLVDHVHCAILWQRWKRLVSFDQMRADRGRSALGPEFIDLVPEVQAKFEAEYQIVDGHRCTANHREYIHLILKDNKDTILSLVITEKKNESFNQTDAIAVMKASGIPIFRDRQGKYEIAGFESDKYLAYVVSNLDRDSNLKIASVMAPIIFTHLHHLEL